MTHKNLKRIIAMTLVCALGLAFTPTYSSVFAQEDVVQSGLWSDEDVFLAQSDETQDADDNADQDEPDSQDDKDTDNDTEPGEQPDEESSKEPDEESSKEPGEESSKEPGEESSKEPGGESSKEPGDESSKEPGEESSKEPGEESSKESGETSQPEAKAAAVTFKFEEGTENIVYLPGYDLLQGVTAADENGDPVQNIRVENDGGFTLDETGENNAYTVTYAANHPVSGETFTGTRTVYAVVGIMPMSAQNPENLSELVYLLAHPNGNIIELKSTIVITSDTNLICTDKNPVMTIKAPPGMRHFEIRGADVTLQFNNVDPTKAFVLEPSQPGGSGGGIICTTPGGNATIESYGRLAIQNGSGMGSGGAIHSVAKNTHIKTDIPENIIIANNSVNNYGGGICALAQDGKLTVVGAYLFGNTASRGGSIYATTKVAFMGDSTIMENTALENGGGLYLNSNGAEIWNSYVFDNRAISGAGLYLASENVELYMNSTSFNGNIASVSGGAITAEKTTSMEIDKSVFSINQAGTKGGAIYHGTDFSVARSTTIRDSILIQNTVPNGGGGAIYFGTPTASTLIGSTLRVTNTEFTENKTVGSGQTDASGAAINFLNQKNLIIEGSSTFTDNVASGSGGAVSATSVSNSITGATFTGNISGGAGGALYTRIGNNNIVGTTFTKNQSKSHGGAVYLYTTKSAQATWGISDVTTTFDACVISDNKAESTSTTLGGGINNFGYPLLIKNSTISGNECNHTGGGVYVNDGSLTITDSTVSGNKSQYGGGLHVVGGLTIVDTKILENTTTGRGGGIFSDRGDDLATGLTIRGSGTLISRNETKNDGGGILSGNHFTIIEDGVEISDNTANFGGGIAADEMGNNSLLLKNIKISNNTARTIAGGGVYANLPKVTIKGVTFDGNKLLGTGDIAGTNGGGALFARSYVKTLVIEDGTTFENNESYAMGGAIATSAIATTINNTRFENNQTTIPSGTANSSGGGAVYAYSNTILEHTLNLQDVTFHKNATNFSGGGLCTIDFIVNIKDNVNVTENSAGQGGGLYSGLSSKLTIKGTVHITGNRATLGGGIYALGSDTLSIEGHVKISDNHAEANGGGVMSSAKNMKFGIIEISGNTAGANGGGVFLNAPSPVFDGTKITGNTADGSGGGIYRRYTASGTSSLTVNGAMVSGNTATSGDGGGIMDATTLAGNTITVSNSEVLGNKAKNGGGVASSGTAATLKISLSTINNNIVTGNGGGVYTLSKLNTMVNNDISKNQAGVYGGGVFSGHDASSDSELILQDVLITKNSITGTTSQSGGAGVYTSNRKVDISSNILKTEISNNTGAGAWGGGILATNRFGGTMTIKGNARGLEIAGNSARSYGGGIYSTGMTTVLGGVTIKNNQSIAGGGISIEGADCHLSIANSIISNNQGNIGGGIHSGTSVTVTDSTIDGNTATFRGGGIYLSMVGANLIIAGSPAKPVLISNNQAATGSSSGGGGGVYFFGANLTIQNVAIQGNKCVGNGGGISSEATGGTLITGTSTSITNNSALGSGHGGGLYTAGTGQTMIAEATIRGNTAANEGGGVYTSGPMRLDFDGDVKFADNAANSPYWIGAGGAAYLGQTADDLISRAAGFSIATLTEVAGKPVFKYVFNNYDVNYIGNVPSLNITVPAIDFGNLKISAKTLREVAKASGDIQVTDGFSMPWTLTAQLAKSFTLDSSPTTTLRENAVMVVEGATTDAEITLLSSAEVYVSTTGGNEDLNVEALKIYLNLPPNSVPAKGKYQAIITWTVQQNTP